jgi:hypothetical protein
MIPLNISQDAGTDLGERGQPSNTSIDYNGSRAMQMAITHPQALVHGVDLLPVPLDPDTFPPNLTFEIDDINHGLGHFNSQFDLIHMRSIIGGITDIKKTMKDLEMCLRPGGLLLVINGDMPFNEDRQTYIKMAKLDGDEDVSGVSEKGSWFRRIVWGMRLLLGISSRSNTHRDDRSVASLEVSRILFGHRRRGIG